MTKKKYIVLLLAGILFFCGGCGWVDSFIFQPPGGSPGDRDVKYLEVAHDTFIGVKVLPIPEGGKYMLLYSGGNAEDLSTIRYRMNAYRAQGYGIAAYDYEGYGQSSGKPSERTLCRDIERVWQNLTSERGIAPESIVIYGRSLGSGPSCHLAGKVNARALVLEAPFTSIFSVANLGWLPFDRFPNISRIDAIDMPLLIIHGEEDEVIPVEHGQVLFDKAREPKRFYRVPRGRHNNLLVADQQGYWRTLADFLKETE